MNDPHLDFQLIRPAHHHILYIYIYTTQTHVYNLKGKREIDSAEQFISVSSTEHVNLIEKQMLIWV